MRLDDAGAAEHAPLPAPGSMPAKELAALPIARRTIQLSVLNVKQELVQGLELCVRPQPHVLDQTFRFHQSEHEFLKTTIRLQGVRWHASAALQQVPPSMPSSWGSSHHAPPPAPLPIDSLSRDQPVWVRCSDPDAVAGVHEQRDATAPLEVYLLWLGVG